MKHYSKFFPKHRVTRLSMTKKFVNRQLQFDLRIHGCKNVTISLHVSLNKFFIDCVSETGLDKRKFHWQQNGRLYVWQVTLTRGMTFISYQNLHATSTCQCKANVSQVNQSWETEGLVMLLPLTRRLFSSSDRDLVVEKKISDNKKVAKLKSS